MAFAPESETLRILLAEDNLVNQEVTAGILEFLGCEVTVVDDGAKAVQAWTTAPDGGFDVVLMDCQMPDCDGFSATRAIRALESEKSRLPILAITAINLHESESACLDAGMDDVLGKPFRLQQLAELLNKWNPRTKPSRLESPIPERDQSVSNLDLMPINALKSLDPDGSTRFLHRTITKFVAYGTDTIASLGENIDEGNALEVLRLAHSLRSSSANLGAIEVARQCNEIEALAGCGQLPPDIDRRFHALAAAYRAAEQDLLALIESPNTT